MAPCLTQTTITFHHHFSTIRKIIKWVARKTAYRAGIRDELRNKPLRQYRDPSLQVAYMFGRVEVREAPR